MGVDISEPIIKLLKERINKSQNPSKLRFAIADATQSCPIKWIGYFNKVFCIDVMEHIDINLRKNLLDFACKTVSPEGLLVITFPMNNYHHGHLITEKDVSNFTNKIRGSGFEANNFYFRPSFISNLTDKIYTTIQKLFYSEPSVDIFEESVNFQLLPNPKWYYKIVKVGTIVLFKFNVILTPLYIPSQPRNATRALIIGEKKRRQNESLYA